jgi:hypothetical protein
MDLSHPIVDPAHPANPPSYSATPAHVTPIPNPAAASLPPEWPAPLQRTVDDLANVPVRLEGPAPAQSASDGRPAPVSGRTLFGFVESLSAFPSPMPEAHKVWTGLRIDTPPPSDKSELVVVPVFGVHVTAGTSGTYAVAAAPTHFTGTPADHFWNISYTGTPAGVLPATATVDRLIEDNKIGARILLKDRFLVKSSPWAGVSNDDWMIQLPLQIADILDPAQTFARALEELLPKFGELCVIAKKTPTANRTQEQSDLLALAQQQAHDDRPDDIWVIKDPPNTTKRAALRLLLAALQWRVLGPCATGTSAVTPLCVALARANTSTDSQSLLAGLTARDAGRAALDDTVPGFMTSEKLQVWKGGHLENLLGLPPDGLSPDWGPSVDTTNDLRSFLSAHWADPTPSPPAVSTWPSRAVSIGTTPLALMQTITTMLKWNGAAWSIARDPDHSLGLFDLSTLSQPNTVGLSLAMNVSQGSATIVASLWLDGAASSVASATSAPIPPGEHTFTLAVTSPGAAPATFGISVDNVLSGSPAPVSDPGFASRGAYIKLQLKTAGPRVVIKTSDTLAPDAVTRLLGNTPDTALRSNAAVAFIAPFIPSVLAGIGPNGSSVPPPPLPGGQPAPAPSPPQAIGLALEAWARDRFRAECDTAIKVAEDLTPLAPAPPVAIVAPVTRSDVAAVEPLLRFVAKYSAAENAVGQIQKLISSLNPTTDYAISVKATPVIFPVDQPQPINRSQDIWSMFSGLGVLAGVSTSADATWPDYDVWYSLNLANMYVSPPDRTTPLPPDAKPVSGPKDGFDPVPLQIGEVGGVRAANISYDNRSLVAEMPHELTHTSSEIPPDMPRRIEVYKFPTADTGGANAKLPALCFGKRYFFLPYLIGHGGALPVCLRTNSASPTTLRSKTASGDPLLDENGNPVLGKDGRPIVDPGGRIRLTQKNVADDLTGVTDETGKPLTPGDLVRVIDYRRTTPVAAPRIYSERTLPGIPEGVEPLGSEIPTTPAAITIGSNETVYFYCNKDKTEGVLDFISADASRRVVQVVLSDPNSGGVVWPPLQIRFWGRGYAQTQLLSITIPAKEAMYPGVRLTVNNQGASLAMQLSRLAGDPFVERPARYGNETVVAPQSVDFSQWEAFFISVTNSSATDVTVLPPAVSLGTINDGPPRTVDFREIPLPGIPQQKRVITVLDGIAPASQYLGSVTLRVRRPAVEFGTFERWINWDLTDSDVRSSLNGAFGLVAKTNPTRNDDLMIDDPAVEKVLVELAELFPNPQSRGQKFVTTDWSGKAAIIGGFNTSRSNDPSFLVSAGRPGDTARITTTADGSANGIVLVPGGVYEVRFYGAIPENRQQLSDSVPPASQRSGKGVWQGLQKFTGQGGAKYRLGAPLVLTFEVSTDLMPDLTGTLDEDPDSPMTVDRLIAQSGDRAQVTLRQPFAIENYPAARYVNRVSLLSQRWGWRGRPAATLPPLQEFRTQVPSQSSSSTKAPVDRSRRLPDGDIKDFETIAFVDRRDDDIGVIEATKLRLAHLMPGVDDNGKLRPADDDGRPPLLRKDLLYRGGANWWRFALSATSRYAPMKPGRNLVRYSQVNRAKATADRHTLIVRDRDTGRIPKRPGLILVLPLTETVMSDVAIPPLLAIFSEPMFPGFHIGDGVEAVLDYARYPLQEKDTQRFWPEFGPDPILTGAAHSGRPVPIRVDGPLGYTFDIGTEAPHFGRSGYLVTPLSGTDNADIRPWSLARLRFRRLEAIELSLNEPCEITSNDKPANLLLTSAGVTLGDTDKDARPVEYHEGLLLDFSQLTTPLASARISVVPQARADAVSPHNVSVIAQIQAGQLSITIDTDLGSGGVYRLSLRPASRAWLRVVLSQREKPQDGNKLYEPVLDVSVQLLVDDGEDGLVRSQAGSWLTVACVPLLAGSKSFMPTDPVYVKVTPVQGQVGALPEAYGVRLTPFTPPLWCQFTQDVSRFDIATTADPANPSNYSVANLAVTLDKNKTPVLWVKSLNQDPHAVQSIKWLRPDDSSQIASVVSAIVTEYITDVSDRVRERPIAVYRIDDGQPGTAATMQLLWPTNPDERSKLTTGVPARVRLLSMMHLQLGPSSSPPTSLADYFNEPFEDTIGMTANDAIGRIVGVSKPIEVSK